MALERCKVYQRVGVARRRKLVPQISSLEERQWANRKKSIEFGR